MSEYFVFDGVNKKIFINDSMLVNSSVSFSMQRLWTDWVVWLSEGDNAKYLPALRVTGGDPIGGGLYVGTYVFLRNDLGWRLVPPNVDGCKVEIDGALYGESPDLPMMENYPDQQVDFIISRSSLVTTVDSGGTGTSGTLSANDIAMAVWNYANKTLTKPHASPAVFAK